MAGGIGIIALVPDTWDDPPRTARHHMLERLARRYPVVWVDPARYWREYLPLVGTPRAPAVRAARPPQLSVVESRALRAKVYWPEWLGRAIERKRLAEARRLLTAQGVDRVVLYLWRPEFAGALSLVEHDLSCYHIDDEYSFSPQDQGLDPAEAELIRRVDQVFIHSHALMEKKGALNPNTAMVPNGVDFNAFALPRPEPADLAPIPHPRAGYVGVIKRHLDLDMMVRVVRRRADVSFVFVGPELSLGDQRGAVETLKMLPNCHFLGGKRGDELPGYMQHLDVGLLCYRIDGYTKYIYPLKLHEYLAAGLPVVATPIRSLHEFSEIIALADSEQAWADAIAVNAATARADTALLERRLATARAHDWDGLLDQIAAQIEARLAAAPGPHLRQTALATSR